MRITCHALLGGAISCLVIPAFAALPEAGYWSFDSELNGKPGRGLQIERQGGETVILSYYGYRPDGSATFYQASGKIAKQETFTADLVEYKNGPALGGPIRSGEVSQVVGSILVKFHTTSSATITLPGEPEQSISRFDYEDFRSRFEGNEFSVALFGKDSFRGKSLPATMRFTIEGDTMAAWFTTPTGENCLYSGSFTKSGVTFFSEGRLSACQTLFASPNSESYLRFEELAVSDNGSLTGKFAVGDPEVGPLDEIKIFGQCYYKPPVLTIGLKSVPCTPGRLGLSSLNP